MNDAPSQRVLVVEDEARLASVLEDYLSAAGYSVVTLQDGRKVVSWVREQSPDLVLLDIMLPGVDGFELCRRLRVFSQVPIIFITARVEEIDRLLGLKLGGDDYICKPFSPREVVARVRTVLRRTSAPEEDAAGAKGLLALDGRSLRVYAGEASIELTVVEYKLLETLHSEPGRIFTRSQLMDRIYQDSRIVSDRTIDSHIKKLRKKLNGLLPQIELIQSVYAAGYRYEPAPRDHDAPPP